MHSQETDLAREQRLAQMFRHAALECAREAGGVDPAHTALFLVGPEYTRPGLSQEALLGHFRACEAAVGRSFHELSHMTYVGSPGLALALLEARKHLQSGALTAAMIAGVDSLLNDADIEALLAQGRLLTRANSDGFIPGEAAACVLVARADRVASDAQLLTLAGIGMADEPDSWSSGRHSVGRGLAQAVQQALDEAGIDAARIHQRLGDCSGESFFLDEAAYAWSRVLQAPSPPGHHQRLIAASVGEIGAASGPLMLALALDAARKGWAEGPASLIHCANSREQRAALVVTAA